MKQRLSELAGGAGIALLLGLLTGLFQAAAPLPSEFDLVILHGRIVDGTGNPWYEGDLGIRGGQIAEIGHFSVGRGTRVIDAKGLIVAPGFIDVHTHVEGGIETRPTADNFLQMGVTSVITGNCGASMLPLGAWFSKLEKAGISVNVGSLVGHNTVRHEGMNGDFDRLPSSEEMDRMKAAMRQAMLDGAVGFSTGLEYVPGAYAKTSEIVELAKISGQYGGLYATHMRNEDATVEQSIQESLEVGEKADCPVEISHFKISSRKRWGASAITTRLIEEARSRGQQVTVDQYLYTAGSTGIDILFPSWVFNGGEERIREQVNDPATHQRMVQEMIQKARRGGFNDFSFATVSSYQANPAFNGRNISDITQMVRHKRGLQEEAEQAIDILLGGGASMVLHKMSDEDVERIFKKPFTMIASDSGVIDPDSPDVPHPRGFGNNARVLGVYVRERKLVSLPEAIRKMTSLPAQTFSLWNRGVLRPGMAADLVIFDERTVADRATYQQPKRPPTGIEYVLVNGQVVIDRGKHTGARPGRILKGAGASPASQAR